MGFVITTTLKRRSKSAKDWKGIQNRWIKKFNNMHAVVSSVTFQLTTRSM